MLSSRDSKPNFQPEYFTQVTKLSCSTSRSLCKFMSILNHVFEPRTICFEQFKDFKDFARKKKWMEKFIVRWFWRASGKLNENGCIESENSKCKLDFANLIFFKQSKHQGCFSWSEPLAERAARKYRKTFYCTQSEIYWSIAVQTKNIVRN